MTAAGRLPVDFDSITYSQERLNEYFTDCSSGKRLVVVQKYGQERLELKNSCDLSIWETICAFFGCGPASFRSVMQFCADRALSHKNLKLMVRTYNAQHASYKQVSGVVQKVLKKDTDSLLLRAIHQQNIEVLRTLKDAPWQSVRNIFIAEENVATEFLLDFCRPSKVNLDVLGPLLQIIAKAPKEDRDIIHRKVDKEGRTAGFLLLLQAGKLPQKMLNLLQSEANCQDSDGRTPLLQLLTSINGVNSDISAILSLGPDLFLKDVNGRGLLAYLCDIRKHSSENEEKTALIIKAVKNLPIQTRQQLVNDLFSYRNEYNRTELLQSIYDDNTTKALLLKKVKRTFDVKESCETEEEIEDALSKVADRRLWELFLDRVEKSVFTSTVI